MPLFQLPDTSPQTKSVPGTPRSGMASKPSTAGSRTPHKEAEPAPVPVALQSFDAEARKILTSTKMSNFFSASKVLKLPGFVGLNTEQIGYFSHPLVLAYLEKIAAQPNELQSFSALALKSLTNAHVIESFNRTVNPLTIKDYLGMTDHQVKVLTKPELLAYFSRTFTKPAKFQAFDGEALDLVTSRLMLESIEKGFVDLRELDSGEVQVVRAFTDTRSTTFYKAEKGNDITKYAKDHGGNSPKDFEGFTPSAFADLFSAYLGSYRGLTISDFRGFTDSQINILHKKHVLAYFSKNNIKPSKFQNFDGDVLNALTSSGILSCIDKLDLDDLANIELQVVEYFTSEDAVRFYQSGKGGIKEYAKAHGGNTAKDFEGFSAEALYYLMRVNFLEHPNLSVIDFRNLADNQVAVLSQGSVLTHFDKTKTKPSKFQAFDGPKLKALTSAKMLLAIEKCLVNLESFNTLEIAAQKALVAIVEAIDSLESREWNTGNIRLEDFTEFNLGQVKLLSKPLILAHFNKTNTKPAKFQGFDGQDLKYATSQGMLSCLEKAFVNLDDLKGAAASELKAVLATAMNNFATNDCGELTVNDFVRLSQDQVRVLSEVALLVYFNRTHTKPAKFKAFDGKSLALVTSPEMLSSMDNGFIDIAELEGNTAEVIAFFTTSEAIEFYNGGKGISGYAAAKGLIEVKPDVASEAVHGDASAAAAAADVGAAGTSDEFESY